MLTVGIDWTHRKHDAVLMSSSGKILERITFTRTATGFNALADGIARHEPDPGQTKFGLELHDGVLLAGLLGQGYSVYGVNPKSAERDRTLYRPSGAKDDQSDAFVLAEMVRTNIERLRSVRASTSVTQELRALVRLRALLVAERDSFASASLDI